MGGYGSGYQGRAKPLTSAAIRLDLRREPFRGAAQVPGLYISQWNRGRESVGRMIVVSVRDGRQFPDIGKPSAFVVPLALSASATWSDVGQTVRLQLAWRPCPFGGHRAYVQCGHCQRPALVLYLVRGGWLCRRCAGVVHPSTRQDDYYRALAKLAGVRRAMGYATWHGDGWAIPEEPGRRMRATTWRRLTEQAKREQRALWEAYERDCDGYVRSLTRLLGASSNG